MRKWTTVVFRVSPAYSACNLCESALLVRMRCRCWPSCPTWNILTCLELTFGAKQADFSSMRHLTWLGVRRAQGDRVHDITLPKGLRRLDVAYGVIPQLDLRSASGVRRIQVHLLRQYEYRNVNTNLDRLRVCLKLQRAGIAVSQRERR